jgi:hypothetical protein
VKRNKSHIKLASPSHEFCQNSLVGDCQIVDHHVLNQAKAARSTLLHPTSPSTSSSYHTYLLDAPTCVNLCASFRIAQLYLFTTPLSTTINPMNAKYPNPLHDGTTATFDFYEVQPVGEYVDEKGRTFVEPILSEDADPKKRFWTIYGHTHEEGVMALVDVDTEEYAMDILHRMGVLKEQRVQ